MNTIGENIALLRKQKGLTQEALADSIGVSAQSVSKWENNTNMPDIMLLPIIADIFDITVDDLFGRHKSKEYISTNQALDTCCNSLLEGILSCMFDPKNDESFEKSFERYKNALDTDSRLRTAVIREEGIVYYRKDIGGLLLKKSEKHWYELLNSSSAADTIEILSNADFRTALSEIIKNRKTVFTLPSLCNCCKIENADTLKQCFNKSKLFAEKTVDIDEKQVTIYELVQGQRLFLMFAALTYAEEYDKYEDYYRGYCADGEYYFA